MKIEILTPFEGDLFDAYDIAELKLGVTQGDTPVSSLRFRALLDVDQYWIYEDESDIKTPEVVVLIRPDTDYQVDASIKSVQAFSIELTQSFLDGLKDISRDSLWAEEAFFSLYAECIFKDADGEEVREYTVLRVKNPWKISLRSL